MSTPNPLEPAAATPLSPPSGQTAGPRLTTPPATAAGGTALPRSAEGRPVACELCEEAEWLLLSGEQWDQVAARLHISSASLARHFAADRHDRRDLLAWRTR